MNVFLMYPDRGFDLKAKRPWNADVLVNDLELNTLIQVMAKDDELVSEVSKTALLTGLHTQAEMIHHRQAIVRDCLKDPQTIRNIYEITNDAFDPEKRTWLGVFSRSPGSVLYSSVSTLKGYLELLKRLKWLSDQKGSHFTSAGFKNFFDMIQKELSDEYLQTIEDHLQQLELGRGVLMTARLGTYNQGDQYILRKRTQAKRSWLDKITGKGAKTYSFSLDPRDEMGGRILSEMEDLGINQAANALAKSADHIESFFKALQREIAFYVGCINLHDALMEKNLPVTFPTFVPESEKDHSFSELYDVSLALAMHEKTVGNTVSTKNKSLFVITGANQGGKSSFLRSIGIAQLMMQSGCFVGAEKFEANLVRAVFTHYKREEDISLKQGKFDEELSRMSAIINYIEPHSLILFNESFASTYEREGSEIARQVSLTLLEAEMKIFYVTHLYDFAHSIYTLNRDDAIFLRANRNPDGSRPFKLVEERPLETSYGEDLYQEIFLAPPNSSSDH